MADVERLVESKKAELRSLSEEHMMQGSQLKARTLPPPALSVHPPG